MHLKPLGAVDGQCAIGCNPVAHICALLREGCAARNRKTSISARIQRGAHAVYWKLDNQHTSWQCT